MELFEYLSYVQEYSWGALIVYVAFPLISQKIV